MLSLKKRIHCSSNVSSFHIHPYNLMLCHLVPVVHITPQWPGCNIISKSPGVDVPCPSFREGGWPPLKQREGRPKPCLQSKRCSIPFDGQASSGLREVCWPFQWQAEALLLERMLQWSLRRWYSRLGASLKPGEGAVKPPALHWAQLGCVFNQGRWSRASLVSHNCMTLV